MPACVQVDRIAQTLEAYGLTGGLDEADFLSYCLHKWRDIHQKKVHLGMNVRSRCAALFLPCFTPAHA